MDKVAALVNLAAGEARDAPWMSIHKRRATLPAVKFAASASGFGENDRYPRRVV
jgi:hypothetical protein